MYELINQEIDLKTNDEIRVSLNELEISNWIRWIDFPYNDMKNYNLIKNNQWYYKNLF